MRITYIIILVLLYFGGLHSYAQVTETQASGLWSNASNWDNGVPNAATDASLGIFDVITIDIDAQCKDLFTSLSRFTVNPGVTFTIFGQCNIATFSNSINNGTLILRGNLVANNPGSTLTIAGSVTSTGGITLTAGTIQ